MKICALHYLNQSIEELQLRKERLEGVIRKIATAQPKTIIDHDRELYGVFITESENEILRDFGLSRVEVSSIRDDGIDVYAPCWLDTWVYVDAGW